MFELVYLHPFTNVAHTVTDESKVAYTSIGVFIHLTKKSTMLVPWHRINSMTGPTESMKLFAEYTAFGV